MRRRTLPVLVVAALLATAFVVLTANEGSVDPVSVDPKSPVAASVARPSAEWSRSGSVVLATPRGTSEPGRDHTRASAPLPEPLPVRLGADDASARLIVSAPPFIDRGSSQDVIVAVRMPSRARSVEFTLSADPAHIELRDASRGAGSPRDEAAFEASVEEVANRIAIKVGRGDGWRQGETFELAVVRIDGVAPGTSAITVSEIGARNAAGAAIDIAPTIETAPLLVLSGPI